MKKNKVEDKLDTKVRELIEQHKYGKASVELNCQLSDIVYKQHMSTCHPINVIIISLQVILLFISVITTILGYHFSTLICIISFMFVSLLFVSTKLHNLAWKYAKSRLKNVSFSIDSILEMHRTILDDVEKQYGIDLKPIRDKYDLNNRLHKYYDAKGRPYSIGDIVYNPSFGDYWVVQLVSDTDREKYKLNTLLCLALWGNKDDYVLDIDEPAGFEIELSMGDFEYTKLMKSINKVAKKRVKKFNGKKKLKEVKNDK